ncbi:MAG: DUF3786 domain-containing protein [Desulfurivibrio sp.]|nr:DUF3786 domain-containing protein [Desulfurivibrio sp.]
MQPFELFKKTPQSNCGRCGYPACLAFAAAVCKGGEDPAKCPDLEVADLGLDRGGEVSLEALPGQRVLELVTHLQSKIAQLSLAELAAPLGCESAAAGDGEVLRFSYLGQPVELGRAGILLAGAEPEDHRDQILLYNYICCRGGAPPSHDWVGLESLPNTISKVRTLATYCEQPLAALFADHPQKAVQAACRAMGGQPWPEAAADLAMIIPVLPRLPLAVLFWAAAPEDGFAARAKVLFDRRVLDFLDVESLVFAAERMAERLGQLLAESRAGK